MLVGSGYYALLLLIVGIYNPNQSFSSIALTAFWCFLGLIIPIGLTWGALSNLIKSSIKKNSPYYSQYKNLQNKILNYKRSNLSFWSSLNGQQFEVEVARVFQKNGYTTSLTKGSGDQGVDINLYNGTQHIIVQCKAHQKRVGTPVIRDLYGTLTHTGADKAFLVSLGGFSKNIDDYILDKNIELFTIHDILYLDSATDNTGQNNKQLI